MTALVTGPSRCSRGTLLETACSGILLLFSGLRGFGGFGGFSWLDVVSDDAEVFRRRGFFDRCWDGRALSLRNNSRGELLGKKAIEHGLEYRETGDRSEGWRRWSLRVDTVTSLELAPSSPENGQTLFYNKLYTSDTILVLSIQFPLIRERRFFMIHPTTR